MEIKESGKKWLLIRSKYIPVQRDKDDKKIKGTGRNAAKTIASIPKNATKLETKEILDGANLTEQELNQWIEHYQKEESAEAANQLVLSIGFVTRHARRISSLAASANSVQADLSQMQVELWKMKKVLKKAKYDVLSNKRCKEFDQEQAAAKQKRLF